MLIHSIEFNLDFHPIPLENFEIAKSIFNKFNQGIKQIDYKNDKIIFISNIKKITKPLKQIELSKGIYMFVYNNNKIKKLIKMIDSIVITAISGSIIAIIVAIYTHIKHSKCFGIEIDTYSLAKYQLLQYHLIIRLNYHIPH